MPTFNAQISANLDGAGGSPISITVTDDAVTKVVETVLAAQPGTLSTRTSGTAGTITMTNAGHGVITGSRIDIYWEGGSAYGATVGTVAGTSVPFTGAAGDALPVATTAVKAGIPKETVIAVDGDNLSALLLSTPVGPANSRFVLSTGAPAVELAQQVVGGTPYYWYTGSGITNPIVGDTIASVWVSHDDTAAAQDLTAAFLFH